MFKTAQSMVGVVIPFVNLVAAITCDEHDHHLAGVAGRREAGQTVLKGEIGMRGPVAIFVVNLAKNIGVVTCGRLDLDGRAGR